MSTVNNSDTTRRPPAERAATRASALKALLREHPDAAIYAQTPDAQVVPVPASLGVDDAPVFATEARTGMDFYVAEDRMTVVEGWMRIRTHPVAEVRVRLLTDPQQWMVLQMVNLRDAHGVVMHVLWPTSEAPEDAEARACAASAAATPRFCTRRQDEEGNVIEVDEAYIQMFGYSIEELRGKPTFESVHPDDQARVIEGWMSAVATGRVQMFRIRMARKDGSWVWVDTTLHNFLGDPEQRCLLAECIDVSAEMKAQEELQDREELLRHLLEEMPDGLLQLDRERRVVYHNARLAEILCVESARPRPSARSGAAPAEVELDTLLAALSEEARRSFETVLAQALEEGARQDVELEAQLPFGAQRHILMKVRPLLRDSGLVTGVIASVLDVTDSARARRELEERARLDALTGAHNRASIMEALAAELETSSETAVVYVDLDHFKEVNDTLGHAAGDEVLVDAAARLRAAMRTSDELGRLGGDEFLILLRSVGSLAVAMSAAQRISESLQATCRLAGANVELCASVGVAYVGAETVTAEELVERADAAMYRSKQQRLGIPILAA